MQTDSTLVIRNFDNLTFSSVLLEDDEELASREITIDISDSSQNIHDLYNKKISNIENALEDTTLIKLGSFRIAKYWGADEDEDEDEDEGNKRLPLGTRQHAVFVGSLFTIATLSGYLGSKDGQSVFASSLAGPTLDIVKKYFPFTKDNQLLRCTIIALSTFALASSFALRYVPDEKKGLLLYRVAAAIPWSYPAFGILKATISSNNISEFLKSKKINNWSL
jgi:hypothetical protein